MGATCSNRVSRSVNHKAPFIYMEIIIVGTLLLLLGIFCYASFFYKSSIFGYMPWQVKTDQKIIALTFDDGPNQPWTDKIASVIESYGGHSTFFVVGKNCERFPGVAKNLQDRGHQIGAHSYSHAFHKYIVDPLYKTEIKKNKAERIYFLFQTK